MAYPLQNLLTNNRSWSETIRQQNPDFFATLSRQQAPKYLWIGCADSRVPANEICGLLPGEIFVHRNIANLVNPTDLNCLAVIQFAVDVLKIEHIIVCGHYGCGGVNAALQNTKVGLVEHWICPIQSTVRTHLSHLQAIESDIARAERLSELNVVQQVVNAAQTRVVRDAWARGRAVTVHGWIYGLRDGLVRYLGLSISNPGELARATEENLLRLLEPITTD
jgi:carbonic anhydrase